MFIDEHVCLDELSGWFIALNMCLPFYCIYKNYFQSLFCQKGNYSTSLGQNQWKHRTKKSQVWRQSSRWAWTPWSNCRWNPCCFVCCAWESWFVPFEWFLGMKESEGQTLLLRGPWDVSHLPIKSFNILRTISRKQWPIHVPTSFQPFQVWVGRCGRLTQKCVIAGGHDQRFGIPATLSEMLGGQQRCLAASSWAVVRWHMFVELGSWLGIDGSSYRCFSVFLREEGGLVWRTLSRCGALPTDVDQFGYHLAWCNGCKLGYACWYAHQPYHQ